MPRVLNRRYDEITENTVMVDRTTKWGNMFRINQWFRGKRLTRQSAIDIYEDWLLYSDQGTKLLEDIEELRGKDLMCWCAPLPCHADILLELANKQ